MKRLLLVDDHPLFRQALCAVLSWAQPDFVIDEADTLEKASATLSRKRDYELVLLDLKMPDCNGFSGLLTLRSNFPQLPIVVVSATSDETTVNRAIEFGAAGFIPKSSTHTEIAKGLQSVLAGDVWAPSAKLDSPTPLASSIASLTPHQIRVLTGLQRGLLNKQIAAEMGISLATVKCHMNAMFKKLGVVNRTQAAMIADALNLPADRLN
jgi:DNA-binding NarL/FixJ family response regulator